MLNYSFRLALLIYSVIIVMLLIAKPYRAYVNIATNNNRSRTTSFFIFVLYAIVLIFAFHLHDTYHYLWLFSGTSVYSINLTEAFEAVYNWLTEVLNKNYILWRTVIWGTACLFTYHTAKKLKLERNGNLFLALVLFGFGLDTETRGILGHTMLLFGVVLLVDKESSVRTKFVGLVLFAVSYFFHKSMYVNIAFALLAFLPFLTKRKVIIASLVAFPFLTTVATFLINGIASGSIDMSLGDSVGGVGDASARYAAGERTKVNSNGVIGNIIGLTPEYIAMFYLIDRVVFKRYFAGIKKEKVFTYLFKLTYVAIYIASLFAFVETSSWIYSRFKYMGFFPMVFVLAKVWSLEPRSNKWVKAIIILQTFSFAWTMAYRLYKWYGL